MDLDIETVQAANWLNQYAPFQAYLDSIRTRSGIAPEGPTGLFGVPRALQLQYLSAENTADAEEETVNSGLLALLAALTIKHIPRTGTWMVRRVSMTAIFAKDKFVARTDGFLLSQDGPEVYLSAISFSREYRRYLDGARLDLPSTEFMKVQQYWPWMVTKRP